MTQSSVKHTVARESFAHGTKLPLNLHTLWLVVKRASQAVSGGMALLGEYILKACNWYRSRTGKDRVGVLSVVLAVVLLMLPSDYVVEGAGPALDVLGTVSADSKQQIIEITGLTSTDNKSQSDTHHTQGKLLMTTVNSYGVGSTLPNAFVLVNAAIPSRGVLPREAVIAPNQTTQDFEHESTQAMSNAQNTAQQVALRFAKQHHIDTTGVQISMHIDDIGGPSAGMMYTLGVLQKLSQHDLTGGATVAGTGTIEQDGTVGAIGGIRFKMLGAKQEGATWFLAPDTNCDDVVGHVPHGMRDVAVHTIDDAYNALIAIGQGKTDSLPHCVVK